MNASGPHQAIAIENIVSLRKHGWKGVDLQVHVAAVNQLQNMAAKCLKEGDWLRDRIEEELAFLRGEDLRG